MIRWLVAIPVGFLLVGCSASPFEPPLDEVAHVRYREIELTDATALQAIGPCDSTLSVSVTMEEINGRSLADFSVVGIWVYHEADFRYPGEFETRFDESTPYTISAAARGGPPWPGRSWVEMIVTLHSEEYGYVSLSTTRGIVPPPDPL